jgi:hypothetical protein
VTGPLAVPSYGVTVQPGETTLTAMSLTRGVSNPNTQRKAFLNELGTILIDHIQNPSPAEAAKLPMAIAQILRDRELLVWLKDPALQRQIAADGFDGRVRTDAGDYLYVVESNLEPTSKYNLVVTRSDELTVALDDQGNASSTLDLTWLNNAMAQGEPYDSIRSYSTSQGGLYGAYVRVLTPSTTSLTSATGQGLDEIDDAEQTGIEASRNVFGNYVLMAPGESNLKYAWTTPTLASRASSGEWTYRLTVQKQPGLRTMPFTLNLQLPGGASVTSLPQGATSSAGTVTLETLLETDQTFEVRYRLS